MPASRAVLADIREFNLDHKVAHTVVKASGRLASKVQTEILETDNVVIVKQPSVSEIISAAAIEAQKPIVEEKKETQEVVEAVKETTESEIAIELEVEKAVEPEVVVDEQTLSSDSKTSKRSKKSKNDESQSS